MPDQVPGLAVTLAPGYVLPEIDGAVVLVGRTRRFPASASSTYPDVGPMLTLAALVSPEPV